VPPATDQARPVPIVFSLHGFAANPDGQRANARWEVLATEQGFLVVYPQGSSFPLRWNVGPQARLDSVDDVRFMLDIWTICRRGGRSTRGACTSAASPMAAI
jgi:poly(3-hydroxybutyrate) depolymerase